MPETGADAVQSDLSLGDDLGMDNLQIESKKKSKSKSKKKKKKNDPSGFEEYYVDPPITAEEYGEEQGLYNP